MAATSLKTSPTKQQTQQIFTLVFTHWGVRLKDFGRCLTCCDRGGRCSLTHSQQLCCRYKIWMTEMCLYQKQAVQPTLHRSWHPQTLPASFTLRAHWKWGRKTNCAQTDCTLVSDLLPSKLPCLEIEIERSEKETVKEHQSKQRVLVNTGHGIHCAVREWPLPSVMAELEKDLVFVCARFV